MITNRIHVNEIIGGRLDPQFYNPIFLDIIDKLKSSSSKSLYQIVKFSNETWNQKDFFENTFPYIEIGAINTISGVITEISQVKVSEAPSRAKKIVRNHDIIISTTRPNRGAISLLKLDDICIASTGFAVIREISNKILREYLFIILRQNCTLEQMLQRSSGGNYPAITEEELKKITIPVPSIEIQKDIVDLYTNAYSQKIEKDQQAKELLKSIDTFLLDQLNIPLPEKQNLQLSFKVNISSVIGQRLDVSFYRDRFELKSALYPNYKLSDIVEVNPSVNFKFLTNNDQISFIPMEVIDEIFGEIAEKREITITNTKGFTKFEEGDLLWAKITPCMQNGKSAITSNLTNGVGCGSTEFYVLRPKDESVSIEYIYCLLRHHKVLEAAKNSFGGSAGQQRVSSGYLKSLMIPVPPKEKQIEVTKEIAKRKNKAKQLQQEGIALLSEAKAKIEQIILG